MCCVGINMSEICLLKTDMEKDQRHLGGRGQRVCGNHETRGGHWERFQTLFWSLGRVCV